MRRVSSTAEWSSFRGQVTKWGTLTTAGSVSRGQVNATLKRHYARWLPSGDRAEVQRLAMRFAEGASDAADRVEQGAEAPDLCPSEEASRAQIPQDAELAENFECEEGT